MLELTSEQASTIKWAAGDDDRSLLLLWGDVGGGKTLGAALALLAHMTKHRGAQAFVAGRSYGAVERNVLPLLKKAADLWGMRWRMRGASMLVDGNELVMVGLPHSRSYEPLMGSNVAAMMVDEVVLIDRANVDALQSRLRVDPVRQIWTTNPGSPRGWVYQEVVLHPERYGAAVLLMRNRDNPAISEKTHADWDARYTGHLRARYLEATWAAAAGLVYPDVPVVPPESAYERVVAGIDFGAANPTAAIFIGQVGERWRVIGEYHYGEGERTTSDHAARIIAMGEELGCEQYLYDPSARMLMLDMRKLGASARKPPSRWKPRNDGIALVDRLFRAGELAVVDGAAPNLLRETGVYAWDERASEDRGEDRPTGENHCLDALRYAVTGIQTRPMVMYRA